MFKLLNNISSKKIILLILCEILIGAGFIVLYAFKLINQTVFTVIIFLVLITSSSLSSLLMNRRFQRKLEKKKRGKVYRVAFPLALPGKVKEYTVNYGNVQFLFEENVIYNLSIIKDPDVFFSDLQEEIKLKIDEKKYTKSIQFFVFDSNRRDLYRKVSILNYQAKKFYVGSFIYDQNEQIIYQTDAVKPNEEFEKEFNQMFKLLKLEEKVD